MQAPRHGGRNQNTGANTKRPYVDTTARRPKPAPLRRVHMMDAVFSEN